MTVSVKLVCGPSAGAVISISPVASLMTNLPWSPPAQFLDGDLKFDRDTLTQVDVCFGRTCPSGSKNDEQNESIASQKPTFPTQDEDHEKKVKSDLTGC